MGEGLTKPALVRPLSSKGGMGKAEKEALEALELELESPLDGRRTSEVRATSLLWTSWATNEEEAIVNGKDIFTRDTL